MRRAFKFRVLSHMNMNMSWLRMDNIISSRRAVRIKTMARRMQISSMNTKRKRSLMTRQLSDRLSHKLLRW